MAPLLPQLPAREALLADFRHVHELASQGRRDEALVIANRIEAAAAGMEVKSSALLLALAVLHDELGHLEPALAYIVKAVRVDPLCPNTDRSLGIIVARVRKALATEKWDEVSPRLYAMLAENGLADAACHVAWANHLHAAGRNEEALEVARSVVLLSPCCASGWQLVEVTALALGREEIAQDAALRYTVAAREDPEDGNSVPRSAWGRAQMPGALVVGLGDAVRALRAREALVRLLSSYAWFIGARLAVKPDGQVVLVAVTTSPSDPEQRAAILARVASHLGGVRLEDRSQNSEMDQARAKHEPGGKDGEKQ